ncbi:hypothetical protein KGQ24_01380 [Patescibacteria group bacterium]|nr:hypothetical protein [Patescibacteria group bacterium]
MANNLKPGGGWVTALKSDIFTWARLKLTATYLLIVAVILIVFSATLYSDVSVRVRAEWERRAAITRSVGDETFYDATIEHLQTGIITVDALMFLLAAGLSYWLAGYTLKPIKKALESQQAFSAEASHELRTPLAVMRNGIEVLLRGKQNLSEEAAAVLKSNLEEIEAMSVMTEDLLHLSRGKAISADKYEKVDLSAVAKAVAEKFVPLAGQRGVKLDISDLQKVSLFAARPALERLIKNIVQNAIVYTPSGGSVSVRVRQENKTAVLEVEDTGLGIPEKDLQHIFERFYKVDRSRSAGGNDSQTGSGLGLAIAKQIADQHNALIDVKSVVNHGTKFRVVFPAS